MLSLFFRNLLFTILQPGIVAGLIPCWILGKKVDDTLAQQWVLNHTIGSLLFITGFVIMLTCIVSFAVKGRGTLSPADPTKKLVISGLYRFSRNPMYVGVMLMLFGESIFFQSIYLFCYSLLIATAFTLFILYKEEPRLRKDFGEEYKVYCKKVRRWI